MENTFTTGKTSDTIVTETYASNVSCAISDKQALRQQLPTVFSSRIVSPSCNDICGSRHSSYAYSNCGDSIVQTICSYPTNTTFKESQNMSFCCAIVTSNGYVLAADSRSTITYTKTITGKLTKQESQSQIKKYTDNFQKIVYLEKAQLGIISMGVNVINGILITNIFKDMEDELCGLSASDALTRIKAKICQMEPKGEVNIFVAKAGNGRNPEGLCADVKYDANNQSVSHYCTDNQQVEIWNGGAIHETLDKIYRNDNGVICVSVQMMPLSELVAFARHLVEMYINVYRFDSRLEPVVGGDVQLLCVDRSGRIFAEYPTRTQPSSST